MYLFFDTETTGLPKSWKAPITDSSNWPRLVQIAWITASENLEPIKKTSHIIKPEGFSIPIEASRIHGIETKKALKEGHALEKVILEFIEDLKRTKYLVAHNISYDLNIVAAEFFRLRYPVDNLLNKTAICTKVESTNYCNLPGNKWPTLEELYQVLFNKPLEDAHDAMADVNACYKSFIELRKLGVITEDTLKTPV